MKWQGLYYQFHYNPIGALSLYVFQKPYGVVGIEEFGKENVYLIEGLMYLCSGAIQEASIKLGIPNIKSDVTFKIRNTVGEQLNELDLIRTKLEL